MHEELEPKEPSRNWGGHRRCLSSSSCLGRLSLTSSSRSAGVKLRNSFSDIQLNIVLRRGRWGARLRGRDRALLIWITRACPSLLGLSCVVRPDTILRWHRTGFRACWRWKSRGRAGRPKLAVNCANYQTDEHGEPVVGRSAHPWRTAEAWLRDRGVDRLQIHDPAARAAVANLADILAQPCKRRCGDRSVRGSNSDIRVLVCVSCRGSRSPTAALVCSDPAPDGGVAGATDRGVIPDLLVHDNDGAYGHAFTIRVRAMGIRDRPIAPRSPWQNPCVERLIGTLRRDCRIIC